MRDVVQHTNAVRAGLGLPPRPALILAWMIGGLLSTLPGSLLNPSVRIVGTIPQWSEEYGPSIGPALRRLSPTQRQRLEDNLVLLLGPDSTWARDIRIARQSNDGVKEPQ